LYDEPVHNVLLNIFKHIKVNKNEIRGAGEWLARWWELWRSRQSSEFWGEVWRSQVMVRLW